MPTVNSLASKLILDTKNPAYRAVAAVRSEASGYWRTVTLPFPEAGIRLLPQNSLGLFASTMQTCRDRLQEAARGLAAQYDRRSHTILTEAYEQSPEGTRLILPRTITGASNLRTTFTKIITRAGHKPWPRLFQNVRASCATAWVERYPNHVVAKWLGHSPMIAATHSL